MAQSIVIQVYLGKGKNKKDVSGFVEGIEYTRSIKKDDVAKFSIRGENAKKILEMDEFNAGKPITFSYGYITGEMTPPVTLILGDIEPDYDTKGTPSLSVSTVDKGHVMGKNRTNRVHNKKTPRAIVNETAKMHGLTANFNPKNAGDVTNAGYNKQYFESGGTKGGFFGDLKQGQKKTGDEFTDLTNELAASLDMEMESYPQANMSGQEMVQDLAAMQDGGNYIAYTTGETLHFVPRGNGGKSTQTIVIGQNDDVMKFSIKYKEISSGGDAGGSVGDGIDETSKKSKTVTADPSVVVTSSYNMNGQLVLDGEGIDEMGTTGVKHYTGVQTVNGKEYPVSVKPQASFDSDTYFKEIQTQVKQSIQSIDVTSLVSGNRDDAGQSIADITKGMMDRFSQGGKSPMPFNLQEMLSRNLSSHNTARRKILTAELKERGNPKRVINTVFTVAGVATRYLGNWYIEEIHDSVTKANFVTSSKASKDGHKRGKIKGKANVSEGVKEVSGNTKRRITVVNMNGKEVK